MNHEEQAKALLPCPFCGGEGLPDKVLRGGCEDGEPDAWAYFVRCRSCASHGPWFKTVGLALRMWNDRRFLELKQIAEKDAEIERLKEADLLDEQLRHGNTAQIARREVAAAKIEGLVYALQVAELDITQPAAAATIRAEIAKLEKGK